MNYLVDIILSVIIAALSYIVKSLLDERKVMREERKKEADDLKQALGEKESAMQEGMTSLLRIQLIEYYEKYMDRGNIPNYAFENWDKMYKAYSGLGGNGMVEHMNDDIDELEIKK